MCKQLWISKPSWHLFSDSLQNCRGKNASNKYVDRYIRLQKLLLQTHRIKISLFICYNKDGINFKFHIQKKKKSTKYVWNPRFWFVQLRVFKTALRTRGGEWWSPLDKNPPLGRSKRTSDFTKSLCLFVCTWFVSFCFFREKKQNKQEYMDSLDQGRIWGHTHV